MVKGAPMGADDGVMDAIMEAATVNEETLLNWE
jgi:hypothetical protein